MKEWRRNEAFLRQIIVTLIAVFRSTAESGGEMVPIMRYFPMQALDFAFKDDFKQRLDYKKFEDFILWVFGEAYYGKDSCVLC